MKTLLIYQHFNHKHKYVIINRVMAVILGTNRELLSRRKDYRILHRRLIALLKYEYNDFNTMRRFFTKEKPPLAPELAKSLDVSTKTVRRHLKDIGQGDLLLLTGAYANTIMGKRPDDFAGIMSEITGLEF